MNTPTFWQDLRQFFARYPTAYAVFIFLQSFALFTAIECFFPVHPDWSFQVQVGDSAARSFFSSVLFPVLFRYLQRHRAEPKT